MQHNPNAGYIDFAEDIVEVPHYARTPRPVPPATGANRVALKSASNYEMNGSGIRQAQGPVSRSAQSARLSQRTSTGPGDTLFEEYLMESRRPISGGPPPLKRFRSSEYDDGFEFDRSAPSDVEIIDVTDDDPIQRAYRRPAEITRASYEYEYEGNGYGYRYYEAGANGSRIGGEHLSYDEDRHIRPMAHELELDEHEYDEYDYEYERRMPMSAAARPGSMPPPVARSSALLGMRSGAPTGRIPLGRSEMMRGPEILPQTPGPYIAKGSVPMPTAGLPRGLPIARPTLHGPGGPIPAIRRPISVPVRPHSRPSVFFSAPASAGHAHVPPVRRMMKPKPDVQVGQQIVPPTGPPIPPTVTIAKRPTNIPIGRTYTPQELVVLEKRACATALRKLLDAPENAHIWVETTTVGIHRLKKNERMQDERIDDMTYLYNPITGDTTYRQPESITKDGRPVHVVKQDELAKAFTKTYPSTLLLKRVSRRLTDEQLRSHCEQFGKVTLAKYMRQVTRRAGNRGGGRRIGYVRMATMEGQEKALSCKTHIIDQQSTELLLSQTRMFIARLPVGCVLSELRKYIELEAQKQDPESEVIDAYLCPPFPQFAVVTLIGRGIASKLHREGDLLYKGRYYLNCCPISVEISETLAEVYNRKMEEFANHQSQKIRQTMRALKIVSPTIKLIMSWIEETYDPTQQEQKRCWTLRLVLDKMNNAFSRGSEEEVRCYLVAMEPILEICLDLTSKLGILAESGEAEFRSFLTGDRPFHSLKCGDDHDDTVGLDGGEEDDENFVEEVMPEAKQPKHEVIQIDDQIEEENPQQLQQVQSAVIA